VVKNTLYLLRLTGHVSRLPDQSFVAYFKFGGKTVHKVPFQGMDVDGEVHSIGTILLDVRIRRESHVIVAVLGGNLKFDVQKQFTTKAGREDQSYMKQKVELLSSALDQQSSHHKSTLPRPTQAVITETNSIRNDFPESSVRSDATHKTHLRPVAGLDKRDESTFLYLLGHELLQKPNCTADISRVIVDTAEKTNHSLDGILAFVSQSPAFTLHQNDMVRLEKSLWLLKVLENSNAQITKTKKTNSEHQDINELTINVDNDEIVLTSLSAINISEGGVAKLEIRFRDFTVQFDTIMRKNGHRVNYDLAIQLEDERLIVTPEMNDSRIFETETIFILGILLLQREDRSDTLEAFLYNASKICTMNEDDVFNLFEAHSEIFIVANDSVVLCVDSWFKRILSISNVSAVKEQVWLKAVPNRITWIDSGAIFVEGLMATTSWDEHVYLYMFDYKFRSLLIDGKKRTPGLFIKCNLEIKLEDSGINIVPVMPIVVNAGYFQNRLRDEYLWKVKVLRPLDNLNRFATIAVKEIVKNSGKCEVKAVKAAFRAAPMKLRMEHTKLFAKFSDFLLVENGMVELQDSALALEGFLLTHNKFQSTTQKVWNCIGRSSIGTKKQEQGTQRSDHTAQHGITNKSERRGPVDLEYCDRHLQRHFIISGRAEDSFSLSLYLYYTLTIYSLAPFLEL